MFAMFVLFAVVLMVVQQWAVVLSTPASIAHGPVIRISPMAAPYHHPLAGVLLRTIARTIKRFGRITSESVDGARHEWLGMSYDEDDRLDFLQIAGRSICLDDYDQHYGDCVWFWIEALLSGSLRHKMQTKLVVALANRGYQYQPRRNEIAEALKSWHMEWQAQALAALLWLFSHNPIKVCCQTLDHDDPEDLMTTRDDIETMMWEEWAHSEAVQQKLDNGEYIECPACGAIVNRDSFTWPCEYRPELGHVRVSSDDESHWLDYYDDMVDLPEDSEEEGTLDGPVIKFDEDIPF